MKLLYRPISPYARKARVVVYEKGLRDRVEFVEVNVGPNAEIWSHNPVGKIPALVLSDGGVLVDSPVICEYLDEVGEGARLVHASGPTRYAELTVAAIAHTLVDSAVTCVVEGRKTDPQRDQLVIDRELGRITSGLVRLEHESSGWNDQATMGRVGAAVLMGYLDFRMPGFDWRSGRPSLSAWYAEFSQRSSMKSTEPPKT